VHGPELVFGCLFDELHQPAYFVGRATPILGGEGVDGQISDAKLAGIEENPTESFVTFSVSEQATKSLFASPPAIAVHDDGHMLGELIQVDP
jgi:hypothetical protein